MNTALRLYHTLRHTKKTQLFFRLYCRVKRKVIALPGIRTILQKQKPSLEVHPVTNPVRDSWKQSRITAPDTFSFLNSTQALGEKGWFPQEASALWSFNLHYFDYLHDTVDTPTKYALLTRWMAEVPVRHPWGWHPYPTSLRVCNWIWFYSRHQDEFPSTLQEPFLNTLYDQWCHVAHNLEYDLLGNHLIENLKCMIIGGCFFQEKKAVRRGLKILHLELQEQICSDGGHFERSPMYHLIVLEALYGITKALRDTDQVVPDWLQKSIQVMISYSEIIFANDSFPLLNDSSPEIAPPWQILRSELAAIGWPLKEHLEGTHHLEESGLIVYHGEKLSLLFDAGPIGPDYLLGHAHNDTLSILLSFHGKPLLTDSGVYTYSEGSFRQYFRSARAHNVLLINNEEPNDIWKAFRVGYRGYPFDVEIKERTFSASDSAYKRLGVNWRRTVQILENDSGIELTDVLRNTGKAQLIEWNFHFAPGIVAEAGENGSLQLSDREDTLQWVVECQDMPLQPMTSWFAEEFGKKTERLCLRGRRELASGDSTFTMRLRLA